MSSRPKRPTAVPIRRSTSASDGDVSCSGRDGTPGLGEPRSRRVETVGTPVGEHDGSSGLGQTPRAGEAEPLRSACHERHLATQFEQGPERRALRRLALLDLGRHAPARLPWFDGSHSP